MFKIQILQDDLAHVLNDIQGTTGDANLGCDNVSVTDLGNNIVEIYTTNSIDHARVILACTKGYAVNQPVQMPYVSFKRFKSIIDSIPKGEFITIEETNNAIQINYGMRKKPITLIAASNGIVPIPTKFQNSGIPITVKKLIVYKAVNLASSIISGSNSISRTIADYMHLDANGFDVEFSAVDVTDNRIFYQKSQTTDNNNGAIDLPINCLKKTKGMFIGFNDLVFEDFGNIIKISGDDKQQTTNYLSVEFYSRKINGVLPQVSNMFTGNIEYSTINTKEFMASLERIGAIEDDTVNGNTLSMNITSDNVNIVKTSQYGNIEDNITAENERSEAIVEDFKISPLADMLKSLDANAPVDAFDMGFIKRNNGSYLYVFRGKGSDEYRFATTGCISHP